jgi:hypothetical protein
VTGAVLIFPAKGRGAWPGDGAGGTLNGAGDQPGPYYRLTTNVRMPQVGLAGWQADQNGTEVSMNDYAVWRAVIAIQTELREGGYLGANRKPLPLDGLFGKQTDFALRTFQTAQKLPSEGIFGPKSAKAMFGWMAEEAARNAAAAADYPDPDELVRVMLGTISHESSWDVGAVGPNPKDVGIGQLNLPSQPKLSVHGCLSPRSALPYMARDVILANLQWADGDIRLAVAAYNLGRGGANSWRKAGFPQYWPAKTKNDIQKYIEEVLNP